MKYTHDTRANKMEEGRVTIQVKYRAIHDDTKYWGENRPPLLGEIDPLSNIFSTFFFRVEHPLACQTAF